MVKISKGAAAVNAQQTSDLGLLIEALKRGAQSKQLAKGQARLQKGIIQCHCDELADLADIVEEEMNPRQSNIIVKEIGLCEGRGIVLRETQNARYIMDVEFMRELVVTMREIAARARKACIADNEPRKAKPRKSTKGGTK